MREVWQPRAAGGATALVYRSQFTTAAPDLGLQAAKQFTTNTKPKLREARTFAVPEAVTAARRVYMPAHIKIAQGGSPCPRIHFHDDSGGATGRIHIGYVGDHLPTANYR